MTHLPKAYSSRGRTGLETHGSKPLVVDLADLGVGIVREGLTVTIIHALVATVVDGFQEHGGLCDQTLACDGPVLAATSADRNRGFEGSRACGSAILGRD